MSALLHIIPLNDLRDHELTEDCWCQPEVDHDGGLVLHNSMDGRESYEQGRKLQ